MLNKAQQRLLGLSQLKVALFVQQTHICAAFDSDSRFFSQDTVVALQALSTSAVLVGSHDFDLTVRVNADASTTVASFHIHQDNYMLHQSQQVHRDQTKLKNDPRVCAVTIQHLLVIKNCQ